MDFKISHKLTGVDYCPMVPGVFPPQRIWINENSSRPCGTNHKGVVDFWRRPKLAYNEVAKRYSRVPRL